VTAALFETEADLLPERLPSWPTLLHYAIERAREVPFDWQAHNCYTFAAGCARAMTGADLVAPVADHLASATSAVRACAHLRMIIDSVLPGRRIEVLQARRGDWLLFEGSRAGLYAVAVCLGKRAACVGAEGMVLVPTQGALCAWRI
jgi:hypothetical protein